MEHCNTDLIADVPGKASYLLKNPFYVIIIQNVKQDVISRISQLFLAAKFFDNARYSCFPNHPASVAVRLMVEVISRPTIKHVQTLFMLRMENER